MTEPGRAPDNIPTPVWIWVAAAVLFAWIVVASLCQPAKCHEPTPFDPPPGTVLVSRNLDPRLNGNWGEWNHLAMCLGNGCIVESQIGIGVIATPLASYMARPYQWFPLYPTNPEIGKRAATCAQWQVGRNYRQGSSLPLVPRIVPWALGRDPNGLNCVSLVSQSYASAGCPWLLSMRVPDDILRFRSLFNPYVVPQPEPTQVLPTPEPQ